MKLIVQNSESISSHVPNTGTYFCTLGYCMSVIEFVESLCLSFRWRGHILSTQSIRSTCTQTETKSFKPETHLLNLLKSFFCLCWSTSKCERESVWTYYGGSLDQVLKLGVAELQADDIIELLSLRWGSLIVTCPLGHWHLCPLLGAHVHHINHPSAPWESFCATG